MNMVTGSGASDTLETNVDPVNAGVIEVSRNIFHTTDHFVKDSFIVAHATPNAGYQFKKWVIVSGDLTISTEEELSPTLSFLMPKEPSVWPPPSSLTIKAIFEPLSSTVFTITDHTTANGTVTGLPATAVAGSNVTATANPDNGDIYF